MNYVIDLDKLSNGIDYWRNPGYVPEKFGSKNEMFGMLKNMKKEGCSVSAYSKQAEKNMPEIIRWFEINGITEIPIIYKKDDDMVEIWNDKALQVNPETGEFIITHQMTDGNFKKTTYAPVQIEVANPRNVQSFQDVEDLTLLKSLSKDVDKDTKALADAAYKAKALRVLQSMAKEKAFIVSKKGSGDDERALANFDLRYIIELMKPLERAQEWSDAQKKKLNAIALSLTKMEYPEAKEGPLRTEISALLDIPVLTRKDHEKQIFALAKKINTEVKPFVVNRNNAIKQRNRILTEMSNIPDGTEYKKFRAPLQLVLDKIKESKKRDYKNVPAQIGEWQKAKLSPQDKTFIRKRMQDEISKMDIEDKVKAFNAIAPRDQLYMIIEGKVDPELSARINMKEKANAIIDKQFKQAYQRDYIKRVKNIKELDLAIDGFNKIDEALLLSDLPDVAEPRIHQALFYRYIKGGEKAMNETIKQLEKTSTYGDARPAVKAQEAIYKGGIDLPEGRSEGKALEIIDEQTKRVSALIAEISKHEQNIDKATPQDIAQAKSAIKTKRAYYRKLKEGYNRLSRIPQQKGSPIIIKVRTLLNQLKDEGFTDLELAILKKAKHEKSLKHLQKKTTGDIGKEAVKKSVEEETARLSSGGNIDDRKMAIIGKWKMPENIANEIAPLYSVEQINQGVPFIHNPQYAKLGPLGEDKIIAMIPELQSIKAKDGLRITVSNSSLDPDQKAQALAVIDKDTSDGAIQATNYVKNLLANSDT